MVPIRMAPLSDRRRDIVISSTTSVGQGFSPAGCKPRSRYGPGLQPRRRGRRTRELQTLAQVLAGLKPRPTVFRNTCRPEALPLPGADAPGTGCRHRTPGSLGYNLLRLMRDARVDHALGRRGPRPHEAGSRRLLRRIGRRTRSAGRRMPRHRRADRAQPADACQAATCIAAPRTTSRAPSTSRSSARRTRTTPGRRTTGWRLTRRARS